MTIVAIGMLVAFVFSTKTQGHEGTKFYFAFYLLPFHPPARMPSKNQQGSGEYTAWALDGISKDLHMLSLECSYRPGDSLSCSPRNGSEIVTHAGMLIERLRRESHLSQEELAERCGLHRTYIGAIERGEKAMTITTANRVAQALGLSLAGFFALLEQPSERKPAVRLPQNRLHTRNSGPCDCA